MSLDATLAVGSPKHREKPLGDADVLSPAKMTCSQKILGIVGDGQLGRMLAQAASRLGVHVKVLGQGGKQSSAGAIAECVNGSIKDPKAVADFAKEVDVLIPEIEHIDVSALGDEAPMFPAPRIVRMVQDKFMQKKFFANAGIELGEYCDIPSREALHAATKEFTLPCMLKSKQGAYDGRGNYKLESLDDPKLESIIAKMGGYGNVYLEKWQPYEKELAVIVVRGKNGEVKTYPVTETIQRNSICFVTKTPANISKTLCEEVDKLARRVVMALNGVGIFGVEMFLLQGGKILLNEVAPRVHNSGHYTLNGCVTSQFENHVRAAFGWPLGDTSLTVPHITMYNILGEQDGPEGERIAYLRMASALAVPNCHVCCYAKAGGVKFERKWGHINIVANNETEADGKVEKIDRAAFDLLTKKSRPRAFDAQTSASSSF